MAMDYIPLTSPRAGGSPRDDTHLRTPPELATLLEVGCSIGLSCANSFWIGPQPGHRLRLHRRTAPPPRSKSAYASLLRFDLVRCRLPSESPDGIVLLNVLEHIDDDRSATAQVARLLKPEVLRLLRSLAGPADRQSVVFIVMIAAHSTSHSPLRGVSLPMTGTRRQARGGLTNKVLDEVELKAEPTSDILIRTR